MNKKLLYIKENKASGLWQYISAISNNKGVTIYNYYSGNSTDSATKSTFNKYTFIEYLKSIHIPNKYIKEVENNM